MLNTRTIIIGPLLRSERSRRCIEECIRKRFVSKTPLNGFIGRAPNETFRLAKCKNDAKIYLNLSCASDGSAYIANEEVAVDTRRQGRAIGFIDPLFEPAQSPERKALDEDSFRKVIAIERKRTERSKAPFVLMLLEVTNHQNVEKSRRSLECIL